MVSSVSHGYVDKIGDKALDHWYLILVCRLDHQSGPVSGVRTVSETTTF